MPYKTRLFPWRPTHLICLVFFWTALGLAQTQNESFQNLPLYPTLSWNLIIDDADPDLFALYAKELSTATPSSSSLSEDETEKVISSRLQALNQKDLSEFLQYRNNQAPSQNPITQDQAQQILDILNDHPVVGGRVVQRYDQQNGQVGFCFGRAHFTHLELLRHGVHPQQIAKIFAVGGLLYGNITWDYHVATAVQGVDQKWWVIDGLQSQVMEVHEWMQKISKWDANRVHPMLRYYLTLPWKFQPIKATSPDYPIYRQLYGPYFLDLSIWHYSHPTHLIPSS